MPVPWRTVPIFGSWLDGAGNLRPGTYKVTSSVPVVSQAGGGTVLTQGLVKTGRLNTDESAMNRRSFYFDSPMTDDPDMFPQGFTLTVEIAPEGSDRITYLLQPKVSDTLGSDAGLNLNRIVLPQVLPLGPLSAAGVRGGLATLDPITGQVLDADGDPVLSGDGQLSPAEMAEIVEDVRQAVSLDDAFTFIVSQPSGTWSINHPFGRLPAAVSLYVDGHPQDIDYEATETSVVVQWPFPVSGRAVIR